MATKNTGVDDYPERPLKDALRSTADHVAAENRATEDQDKDYHKRHPTLKAQKTPKSPDVTA